MKTYRRTPLSGAARNVVVCIDGTWNHEEQQDRQGNTTPTNVVKISRSLIESEAQQVVGYFPGLGNEAEHWYLGQFLGGAFGAGAYTLLHEVHFWLCQKWRPGDRLFIFGFSRGAALARMLANSVRKTGIAEQIDIVWKRVGGPKSGHRRPTIRRRGVVKKVPVSFLGCFDTVASFGFPRDFGVPFQQINLFKDFRVSDNVEKAVHLLALDETRGTFVHTPMEPAPNVEEVWFAGWHGDVGGGWASNGLSDIALEFMVSRAQANGLLFKEDWREEAGHLPDCTAPLNPSSCGWANGSELRQIPKRCPVHVSVRERMEKIHDYRPQALTDLLGVRWVES